MEKTDIIERHTKALESVVGLSGLSKIECHNIIKDVVNEVLNIAGVVGSLPTDEEIKQEAELRYPVTTHSNPENSPYVGSQKTFMHGCNYVIRMVKQ